MSKPRNKKEKKPKNDGRRNNGGGGRGAGRLPGIRGKLKRGLFTDKQVYVFEEIVVTQFRHGQMRRTRTTRGKLAMERLCNKGSAGNNHAQSAYLYLEKLKKSNSDEKWGDVLFKICKDMEKLDRVYVATLNTMAPRRKLIPDTSIHGRLVALKKKMDEANRKVEERAHSTPQSSNKDWLKERLAEIKSEKSYIIDKKTGRKVLTEKAASRGNDIAIARHLESKKKKPKPFDYQYRREPQN